MAGNTLLVILRVGVAYTQCGRSLPDIVLAGVVPNAVAKPESLVNPPAGGWFTAAGDIAEISSTKINTLYNSLGRI